MLADGPSPFEARTPTPPFLSSSQIGRSGELLVQYRLLKHGIESAPMTTDAGIDLVVYAPRSAQALTIQVKTNHRPKPGGGKGRLALDWWIREDSPAQLVALVDLSSDRVWMMRHAELISAAQQRSSGRAHVYFYVETSRRSMAPGTFVDDFGHFELERRLAELFGA